MLTRRMQIQIIADRLAGLPADAQLKDFDMPWQLCWQAVENAKSGQEADALSKAIAGLPDPKDILETILATKPGYRPHYPSLAEIAKDLPPIEWVWDSWIPRGMLTVMGASQGSGKSFVAMDLAYRIIHNLGFPDGSPVKRPGANIIYVDAEFVPQILNERSRFYRMDQTRLFMLLPDKRDFLNLNDSRDQDRLSEMAAIMKPELIVIDSFLSIHSKGQNNVEDVRGLIGYLTRLASWANCGLILIHHIRKPAGGGQRMMNVDLGMEDLSGSGFITQQARTVLGLHVVQTGAEFDPNGPREFKMLKNSLGRYPDPMGFSFVPLPEFPGAVRVNWQKQSPKTYTEPTRMDECKEWLEDLLKSNPDGLYPKDVIANGKEMEISQAMIFRAKRELNEHIVNTVGHKAPKNRWKWSDTPVENQPDDE